MFLGVQITANVAAVTSRVRILLCHEGSRLVEHVSDAGGVISDINVLQDLECQDFEVKRPKGVTRRTVLPFNHFCERHKIATMQLVCRCHDFDVTFRVGGEPLLRD